MQGWYKLDDIDHLVDAGAPSSNAGALSTKRARLTSKQMMKDEDFLAKYITLVRTRRGLQVQGSRT